LPCAYEQRWKPHEDEILKNNYGAGIDIQKLLPNRSRYAIKKRAELLGLTWKPKNMVSLDKLTEFELGWLTAIIEGEGTLTINNKRNPRPVIQVANTDLSIVNTVSRLLNVGFVVHDARKNRVTSYYIIINSVWSAYNILKKLQPCFMSERKKELCSLLLRFCELKLNRYYKKKKIPKHIQTEIQDIMHKVAKLNRKGRHIPALS